MLLLRLTFSVTLPVVLLLSCVVAVVGALLSPIPKVDTSCLIGVLRGLCSEHVVVHVAIVDFDLGMREATTKLMLLLII